MRSPIVLIQATDAAGMRRLEEIIRRPDNRRLTPLLASRLVREMGDVAPFICPCGCGRIVDVDDLVRPLERGAVLS